MKFSLLGRGCLIQSVVGITSILSRLPSLEPVMCLPTVRESASEIHHVSQQDGIKLSFDQLGKLKIIKLPTEKI
jgi:hypothetical protein